MRQLFGRAVWVGNAGDLRDAKAVLASGVEAVIELADQEPRVVLPRDVIRCRFPLSDGADNPSWLLRLAVESVAALYRARVPVLVCCSAGMSRSLCITAAAIALVEGSTLVETLKVIGGSGPADVSPALLGQLQQTLRG